MYQWVLEVLCFLAYVNLTIHLDQCLHLTQDFQIYSLNIQRYRLLEDKA